MKKGKLAGGVLLVCDKKFLLVKRSAHYDYPNVWAVVGGGVEPNETSLMAIKRELKEETQISSENINFKVNNLSVKFNDPFLTDLKNINFEVKEGEIFGIAGVAGNGQSELMEFLTGENIHFDSGSIIFDNKKIETFDPKKRRDLSEQR